MNNTEGLQAYIDALQVAQVEIEKRGETDRPLYNKITEEITKIISQISSDRTLKEENESLKRALDIVKKHRDLHEVTIKAQQETIDKKNNRIRELDEKYVVMLYDYSTRIRELEDKQKLELLALNKVEVGDKLVHDGTIEEVISINNDSGIVSLSFASGRNFGGILSNLAVRIQE